MRRMLPAFVLAALIALPALAPRSVAAVPSPAQSDIDTCLNVCPAGDIPFRVTVKDAASNPVANSFVWIDVCQVPAVHVCPGATCSQLAAGFTDASGTVYLFPHAGGVSPPPWGAMGNVYADGILLVSRVVGSPDQDGDLTVTAADLAIGAGKLGLADPTLDLNCDRLYATGVITDYDLDLQAAHLGHVCSGPTPTRGRSWGELKIRYR